MANFLIFFPTFGLCPKITEVDIVIINVKTKFIKTVIGRAVLTCVGALGPPG